MAKTNPRELTKQDLLLRHAELCAALELLNALGYRVMIEPGGYVVPEAEIKTRVVAAIREHEWATSRDIAMFTGLKASQVSNCVSELVMGGGLETRRVGKSRWAQYRLPQTTNHSTAEESSDGT